MARKNSGKRNGVASSGPSVQVTQSEPQGPIVIDGVGTQLGNKLKDMAANGLIRQIQWERRMDEGMHGDGWGSTLTSLGSIADKRSSFFPTSMASSLSWDDEIRLYRGGGLASRIVDMRVDDMVREGWEVQIQDHKAEGEAIDHWLEDLGAKEIMRTALQWDRAYGGSGGQMGLNGGYEDGPKPLDLNAIDSIDWLQVWPAYELQQVAIRVDPRKPLFGLPEAYRIIPRTLYQLSGQAVMNYGGVEPYDFSTQHERSAKGLPEIHRSRMLVFPGIIRDRRQRLEHWGWGDSVLAQCFHALRDFGIGFEAVPNLIVDFAQAVLAIPNLWEMIQQDQDHLIVRRASLIDRSRSTARMILIDAGNASTGKGAETFKREPTPVAGLADLLDRMMQRLSAETGYAVTRLMGRSAAGMNATGENDIRSDYDASAAEQERVLLPRLRELVLLGMRSKKGPTKGVVFPNWSIRFNALWQPTEQELAETRKTMAEADKIYLDMGVLSAAEIRKNRFGGDQWQVETQLDPEEDALRQQMAEAQPEPGMPTDEEVSDQEIKPKDKVLSGDQINALTDLLGKVKTGELEDDAAVIALQIAFPTLDEARAKELVGKIEVEEPEPVPAQLPGGQNSPPVPPPGGAAPPTPAV